MFRLGGVVADLAEVCRQVVDVNTVLLYVLVVPYFMSEAAARALWALSPRATGDSGLLFICLLRAAEKLLSLLHPEL